MKNFYLWIVAAMVCIGILPAAAQDAEVSDITFKVNISDAEGIKCYKDYTDEIPLKDGINEFSFPNGTNLKFESALPWQMKSVVNKNGTGVSSFYGNSWYLYVGPDIADEEFSMTVININDARTSQFTLKVDDPALVTAVLGGYYEKLDLKAGENIIKFDPAVENNITISPVNYGVPFYYVKKNDVELAPAYGDTYEIALEEDCVIDVAAVLPEGECTVDFSYSEGAETSFSLKLNGESVPDFNGKSLTVKVGDKLSIECNKADYKFEKITINGNAVSFWSSYDFVVVKDTEVYIEAHPYGDITATIIINNPQLIKITCEDETLALNEGENVLKFRENSSNISWTVDPMGVINSVAVNGGEPLMSYQTYYTLLDNDVIVFDVVEKNFDKKFMVWIDNIEAASCSNYFEIDSESDRSFRYSNSLNSYQPQKDFENGYTEVKFYQALNPFIVSWSYAYNIETPEYKGQGYINDNRLVSSWGAESTYFNTSINDGDVLKFFFEAAPVECKVAFDIAEGVEANVVKDIITTVEKPAEGFDCFAGTQVVVSGENIEVKVNGSAVSGEKDEDGVESFTFIVADAATSVAVTAAGGSAVEAIEAEAGSAVFNMQGVRVGSKADLKSLAPGIYIVAGKKVVVTE